MIMIFRGWCIWIVEWICQISGVVPCTYDISGFVFLYFWINMSKALTAIIGEYAVLIHLQIPNAISAPCHVSTNIILHASDGSVLRNNAIKLAQRRYNSEHHMKLVWTSITEGILSCVICTSWTVNAMSFTDTTPWSRAYQMRNGRLKCLRLYS